MAACNRSAISEENGMEAPASRAASVAKPPRTRSAVSNGSRLFVIRPGDSVWGRRFRDVLAEITNDLGGSDRLSEGQRQLARRAATISIMCEQMEGVAAAGEAIDLDSYGTLTDRLGRVFQRLGLERKHVMSVRRSATSCGRGCSSHEHDARRNAVTLACRSGSASSNNICSTRRPTSRSSCSMLSAPFSRMPFGRRDGRLLYPEQLYARPKKSGKTGFAAMHLLTTTLLFGGRFAEGYAVANDFEQAQGRVFEAVAAHCEASPLLAARGQITRAASSFRRPVPSSRRSARTMLALLAPIR